MLLAFGVLCGVIEARISERGQVIDAAMVDGTAILSTILHASRSAGIWHDERGSNLLDGGAPFYNTYETADGEYISIGAIEPHFFAQLLETLGLRDEVVNQWDRAAWPSLKERLAAAFRRRTRAQWCEVFDGTDVCFAPVLTPAEAPEHPHLRARGTFTVADGMLQPAPAPRFSRTPGAIAGPPPRRGEHTKSALAAWGLDHDGIEKLVDTQVIRQD
jgi:alpha-methylacyl-CoA racemase